MTQNVPLDKGDVAIEPFFDAVQELLGSGSSHFRLGVTSATAIQVEAGAGNDQSTVAIDGAYRYRTANLSASHPGGAAGTYSVYVTAAANNFTGPPSAIDLTDYAFGLTIPASGVPGGVDHYRKVAEIEWDGTTITFLRILVGSTRATNPINPRAGAPGASPAKITMAATQAANPLIIETSLGVQVWAVTPSGGALYGGDVTMSSVGGLTLSGAGGKDTLALTSTAADTGITLGGDVTLYRSAADVLKTDDALTVVGLLTLDANVTLASASALTWGGDTNLYRGAASVLKTDDTFNANAYQVAGTALNSTHLSNGADIAFVNVANTFTLDQTISSAGADALRLTAADAGITFGGDATLARTGANVLATATAAVDTNTTQIATTAFVVGQAGAATPLMDDTGAVGISTRYSRQDHVHPTDTTRAPLASPTFTGSPAAPTPSPGDNDTSLATTAFVTAAITAATKSFNTTMSFTRGEDDAWPGATKKVGHFRVRKQAGQTVTLTAVDHMLDSGSGATFTVYKNGVALTGSWAGIAPSTTEATTNPTDEVLADGDRITLYQVAAGTAPKGGYVELVLLHTVA